MITLITGYGFSDGAIRPGLNTLHMAKIFDNLMERIGIQTYYVQGGDWGGIIAQLMGALYPDNVLGVHSNMCYVNSPLEVIKTAIGSIFPSLVGIPKKHHFHLYPISRKLSHMILETGYLHLQATKPDTIGKQNKVFERKYKKIIYNSRSSLNR